GSAGGQSAEQAAAGEQTQTEPQPAGYPIPRLGEILAQVTDDRAGRAQHRQDVDEAEQLDLDCLVAHAPAHQAVVPPARREQNRPIASQPAEDLAAVVLRQSLQLGGGRHDEFRASDPFDALARGTEYGVLSSQYPLRARVACGCPVPQDP